MYGKEVETSEDHCPSKVEAVAKSGGMPFTPTAQTANNVKVVVQCCECEKWRLIQDRVSPQEGHVSAFPYGFAW